MEFVEEVLGVVSLGAVEGAVPVNGDAGGAREGGGVDAPFCAADDGVCACGGDF